jgi:hypothetical protein
MRAGGQLLVSWGCRASELLGARRLRLWPDTDALTDRCKARRLDGMSSSVFLELKGMSSTLKAEVGSPSDPRSYGRQSRRSSRETVNRPSKTLIHSAQMIDRVPCVEEGHFEGHRCPQNHQENCFHVGKGWH